MTSSSHGPPIPWRPLYLGAAGAGACLGILLGLRLLPYIPDQLSAWMLSVGDEVAFPAVILAGGVIGLVLALVAHIGVSWQLRRSGGTADD